MHLTKIHLLLLLAITAASLSSHAQVIGGRENSEMTPKAAEATKLSGGGFVGDVNVMTGEFQASIPLGSVSTPAGLGFSLSLNHSSSFAFSTNQPMTAGIPYGDGWSPNLPTISIETDVFRKFGCTDLIQDGGPLQDDFDLKYHDGTINAADEGDLYWFSPMVNIPGVASGRAVFKYVDVADSKCLVFVLNKFESPVELRYYGNSWTVKLADGTIYQFGTHLANYRSPSNQRILYYDQTDLLGDNVNQNVSINDSYGTLAPAVQNVIEPKQTYSVWHCDVIFNQNTPLQGVRFTYEKFGKFNYYEEFNQVRYQEVRASVFSTSLNTDFSAYSDIFLQRVYSYVMESPLDIIELEYKTNHQLVDNGTMLDFNQMGVERKDSLYSYKTVRDWGDGMGNFNGWHRAKHWASVIGFNENVNSSNPYLSTASTPQYMRENGPNGDEMAFDHGFLESERFFDGPGIYPGDVYEIRTTISRPDGSDYDIGNGTLDIAIKTGTLGNGPSNEGNQLGQVNGNQTEAAFDGQKGVEIFSTFNSALKWQMGYGQSVLTTSNLFVMPNIPSTYHGLNIQIGPGNSDIDFNANTGIDYSIMENGQLDLRKAYPFFDTERSIKSTANIPHNFGTGHPWGMMIPVYNKMALSNPSLTNPQPDEAELYQTWWKSSTDNFPNQPTKFDNTVKLEKVELIRYSKNPYMLSGVKVYKANGDYAELPNGLNPGKKLVSQKRLEYTPTYEYLLRNYDVEFNPQAGNQLHQETAYQRRVILLTKVREVPVENNMYGLNYGFATIADTSKILTTFLGYTKILDNAVLNGTVIYDGNKPYVGLNQYVLDTYVDHLGGITKVEYYPFGGNGETRFSSNYEYKPCNINITRQSIGQTRSYTGHAAVKFLGKKDVGIVLNTGDLLSDPSFNVWEYQYDLSSKIFNPKQMDVASSHFDAQHLFREEKAFGKVRVISPELTPGGEHTYVDYEYYGNTDYSAQPTIEQFLLYGKIKTQKTYNQSGVLHDEKIYNYDYTLAFENAYKRPNLMRELLGYDDYYARSYEYEDIYKNEVLTMDVIQNGQPTTVQGANAYSYIDAPYLRGNYSNKELPKFMEFWFYNELVNANEKYFFDSYFIKKTSEITRVYDNSMVKSGVISTPVGPNTGSSPDNPFGTGVVNPVADDPIADVPLQLMIDQSLSQDAAAALLAASPLSDAVLNHAITSNMKPYNVASVIAYQTGVSNAVWEKIIDQRGKFSGENYDILLTSQPYFSDAILSHLIQDLNARDNYTFVSDLLLKNEYLSESIILQMTNAANEFPEQVFATVIRDQSNLSEATLLAIIQCVHVNDNNLGSILSDQVVTDALWFEMMDRSMFTTNTFTQLAETSFAYPSDAVLLALMDYEPNFEDREMERIMGKMNRPISTSVAEKLLTNYAQIAPQILAKPFSGNPLDQYCHNEVIVGRKFIETRTDYEYYEADHRGTSIGKAHEILLGHRSTATDPSPYPFNQMATTESNASISHQVTNLRLKHEPSWQVFSVETSSPQHPGAYSREEYFYLYDLQNRYDRYWYNYDLQSGDYTVLDFNPLSGLFSGDTIAFNVNWHGDYANSTTPLLPQFDGMQRTRAYGNRVLAFQKSVISKNTRDLDPLIRSEYYDYDGRWIFDDLPGVIEVVTYNGELCPTAPPNGPCSDLLDCTDCYGYKYTTDDAMIALVPLGHCAWVSPEYGSFICPYGSDVYSYAPNAQLIYCNLGISSSDIVVVNPLIVAQPKALQPGDALGKALLLRSVTIQVDTLDHSSSQTFAGLKMDTKNAYVAEFKLGGLSQLDANDFAAPYSMVYPFDNLTVRTIKERNRYLQPALEENQVGLQTKYYYNKSKMVWNTNANCTNPAYSYLYNYSSTVNDDIGQPIRITVGFNKVDSLSSTYEYNSISLVNKVTEPSGRFMEYAFDGYFRLVSIDENGNRHLTDLKYNYWKHAISSFENRTEENFVQTIVYNDNPALDPLGINNETRKAFIDPLGRNHSVATRYSLDGNNDVEIHSGSVEYDNWSRVIKAYKNYALNVPSAIGVASTIALTNNNQLGSTYAFAETKFENDPKGRALRTSNYGVDVNGIHAVKYTYSIVNDIFTSCELELGAKELQWVMGKNTTTAFCLLRAETLDQDNKKSVEYTNALGQKVASLKYNTNNVKIVTLFVYDSYGNLAHVRNPEKQNSYYEFNMLGQLVKERTIDAGTRRYMYNKQGLVSITLDEQGQFYNPNGGGMPGDPTTGTTNAFYRVYQYDDFGRVTKVGRSTNLPEYSLNQEFGPLHYKTTQIWDGPGVPENGITSASARYFDYTYTNASSQDWLASFQAWGLGTVGGGLGYQVVTISGLGQFSYPTILEKENFYGGNVTTNEIGQIVKTLSYNNDGMKVQRTQFTYDDNNNLATQLTAFNPNMDVDVAPIVDNIVSAITYPAYNYRNSLLQQTVDVNNDQTIDYHCYMQYDALNRLKAIYAAAGLAPTVDDATLLVSYAYDDANGLVDKKTHHIDDQGLAALVNEIDYSFDVRDRLTSIKAGLPTQAPMMNYQLYYDDQNPQYLDGPNVESVLASNNWNGNINGTQMEYSLQSGNIANPVLNYTKPLLYGYSYDKINRMTQADATVGDFLQGGSLNTESHAVGDESVRYDRIGNIKNMHRTLRNNDPTVGAPFSEVQHWNYSYDGSTNRLATVDGVNGTVSRAYLYDGNGNMLTDNSKNITGTEYGRSAYPFEMSKGETDINYLYSSNDLRIYKKSVLYNEETNEWAEDYYLMDAMGKTVAILHRTQNDISGKWEYYASGSERECRLVPTAAQSPINNVNVGNASIAFGKDQASFYLYDHLGNTRITYTPTGFIAHPGDVSTSVNIINNVMDYFPYGKILREYVDGEQERYLTTQHERDTETDLDYRGARYYDNEVGRFLSLDPLAREYPAWSAYNYVMGNPIYFIDPDGQSIKLPKSLIEVGDAVIGQMIYDLRYQSDAKIDHSSIEYEVNKITGVVRLVGNEKKIQKTIDKLYKAGDQHSKELANLYQTLLSPDIELTVKYSSDVADDLDVEVDGNVLNVNDDIQTELDDPNKTNSDKKPTRTEMHKHLMTYFFLAVQKVSTTSSGGSSPTKKPKQHKTRKAPETTIPGVSEEEIYEEEGIK